MLTSSGLLSAVDGRGVQDSSGSDAAVIVLGQYNPKLTAQLDRKGGRLIEDFGPTPAGALAFLAAYLRASGP